MMFEQTATGVLYTVMFLSLPHNTHPPPSCNCKHRTITTSPFPMSCPKYLKLGHKDHHHHQAVHNKHCITLHHTYLVNGLDFVRALTQFSLDVMPVGRVQHCSIRPTAQPTIPYNGKLGIGQLEQANHMHYTMKFSSFNLRCGFHQLVFQ